MFIDEASIHVAAGDGGNGCMAFRRERSVPKGGPSGGDGGRGGSVHIVVDSNLNTLYPFRFRRRFAAGRGGHGEGSTCHGKNGKDVEVDVPVGTIVADLDTGEVLGDLIRAGDRLTVARGGRGGRGNARFATSTNRAPRKAEPGAKGEQRDLALTLKLLADVALIGLPNAGKSTLISAISAARPRIADYPFTTLVPNLGVVSWDRFRTFVAADIPGLIDGASQGHGLGIRFLRHVERSRLIAHLVDASALAGDDVDVEAEKAVTTIESELEAFSPDLAARERILVATKRDVASVEQRRAVRRAASRRGFGFFEVSGAAHVGLGPLVMHLGRRLEKAGEAGGEPAPGFAEGAP